VEGSESNPNNFDEFSHFFQVRLDLFDGPIDLLLHLVKIRELPIEKLSLASVANQYLECIESARKFDLEIAGEYLVIAATLLSIKSSVLLGEPVGLIEDADGNLVDPHDELLRRLREAEVYKESVAHLTSRALLGVDVFANNALFDDIRAPEAELKDHDPFLLGKAFKKLLENAGPAFKLEISYDPVSIVQRMMEVIESLKQADGRMEFYKLVPDLTNRASIITTFIALLELCKRQIIEAEQKQTNEEIFVVLKVSQAGQLDLSNLSSEFDAPQGADDEVRSVNG